MKKGLHVYGMDKVEGIIEHTSKWNLCDRCPIGDMSKRHVLYRGTIPASLMLVGEAPGATESVTGLPFSGKAGRRLDMMIAEADVQSLYCVSNIIACRPVTEDRKNREPTADEIDNCRERLIELVDLVEPRVVVLMGQVAHQNFQYKGVRIYHTYHPAYVERQVSGGHGWQAHRDVVRILQEADRKANRG